MTIMENFSEKKKRGRPQGQARQWRDALPDGIRPDGGIRTQTDWCYMLAVMKALGAVDAVTQRAVVGCTPAELEAGSHTLPKGFKTAAVEAGRYIAAGNVDAVSVVQVIANARRDGFSWPSIAAHFRRERLGDRRGTADGLMSALCRALNDYRRRFPAMPNDEILQAATRFINLVQSKAGGTQ